MKFGPINLWSKPWQKALDEEAVARAKIEEVLYAARLNIDDLETRLLLEEIYRMRGKG